MTPQEWKDREVGKKLMEILFKQIPIDLAKLRLKNAGKFFRVLERRRLKALKK